MLALQSRAEKVQDLGIQRPEILSRPHSQQLVEIDGYAEVQTNLSVLSLRHGTSMAVFRLNVKAAA